MMRFTAFFVALMLFSRASFAAPCAPEDAKCITRKALEYKYKADALEEENNILRQELAEEQSRNQSGATIFLMGGIAFLTFFGGGLLLYKNLK